jgi:hypothetical protein
MAEGFVERHDDSIAGVLSCYDRIIITGTLPGGSKKLSPGLYTLTGPVAEFSERISPDRT